ncbi:MAG: hypothetical protein HXX20_22335, partial [Chloroflexi bacterium]|nr:hypothetical protein [Chloroflexota bacterium]
VVATTVAATTEPAIATTVAATTAPAIATTVAAQAATTAAASPTVIANNSAGRENRIAINIAGATEIKPSATFGIMLGKLIPGQTNPNVQFYASDDESDKLANNADSAFVEAGYKFGLPGQNKPLKHEHTIVGFYTKSGSPDLLIAAATVQDDTSDITKALRVPGMTAEEISRLTEEVKNKRSLMVIIAAPKLLESTLIAAMGNTTPTPDSNSSGPEIGEKDVPVYAGSKRIIPASGLVDGVTSLYYTSNDNYEKMVVWAKKAFIEKGWTEVSIFESESKVVTAITGKKNGYSLLGTIVSSSKVHGSRGYDSVLKLVNIGPNDSVIAIVVGKY